MFPERLKFATLSDDLLTIFIYFVVLSRILLVRNGQVNIAFKLDGVQNGEAII